MHDEANPGRAGWSDSVSGEQHRPACLLKYTILFHLTHEYIGRTLVPLEINHHFRIKSRNFNSIVSLHYSPNRCRRSKFNKICKNQKKKNEWNGRSKPLKFRIVRQPLSDGRNSTKEMHSIFKLKVEKNYIIKSRTMLKQIRKRKREMIRQKIQQPLMPTAATTRNHQLHLSPHRRKKVTMMARMMRMMRMKKTTTKTLIMPVKMMQMKPRRHHRKTTTKMNRVPATKKLKIGSFFSTTHSHTHKKKIDRKMANTCWRWLPSAANHGEQVCCPIRQRCNKNDSHWGSGFVSNACAWIWNYYYYHHYQKQKPKQTNKPKKKNTFPKVAESLWIGEPLQQTCSSREKIMHETTVHRYLSNKCIKTSYSSRTTWTTSTQHLERNFHNPNSSPFSIFHSDAKTSSSKFSKDDKGNLYINIQYTLNNKNSIINRNRNL